MTNKQRPVVSPHIRPNNQLRGQLAAGDAEPSTPVPLSNAFEQLEGEDLDVRSVNVVALHGQEAQSPRDVFSRYQFTRSGSSGM